MKKLNYDQAVEAILLEDDRYHRAAYHFIRESLGVAAEKLNKPKSGQERHLSAHELMDGIKDCALEQFGQMSFTVLNEWGVHSTVDFGQIVFNLVEIGLLRKSDEDKLDDFADGYDFFEAFRTPYETPLMSEAERG